MENDRELTISTDSNTKPLTGEKFYSLRLDSFMPKCKFWSLIVYDNPTGLIIITDQPWPSVHSNCKNLLTNNDGSVNILFGPEISVENRQNQIITIPGKTWFAVLRLYGLSEPVQSSWDPGTIEEIYPGV
jgi:hypothetical protein